MKSNLLFAIFMILGINLSFGQFYIGTKVGYNIGQVSADKTLTNIFDPGINHGVTAGAVGGYTFNQYFDLQTELLITQKGFSAEYNYDFDIYNIPINIGADVFNKYTYIELPILAKGKIGNDIVQGYAAIGPQLGYMVKGRLKANANILIPITIVDRTLNLDQGFNRFEVSGVGALGVQFNLGVANLFIEGRYTHGFTDFYTIPLVGNLQLDTDIQNRNYSANIGMTFPLGASNSKGGNAKRF